MVGFEESTIDMCGTETQFTVGDIQMISGTKYIYCNVVD